MLCCDPSNFADTHNFFIPTSYLVSGRSAGIFSACFMSISISALLKTQHPPMPVLCAEGWVYPHSPFYDSSSRGLECGIHLVFHSPTFGGSLSHPNLHLDILPPETPTNHTGLILKVLEETILLTLDHVNFIYLWDLNPSASQTGHWALSFLRMSAEGQEGAPSLAGCVILFFEGEPCLALDFWGLYMVNQCLGPFMLGLEHQASSLICTTR